MLGESLLASKQQTSNGRYSGALNATNAHDSKEVYRVAMLGYACLPESSKSEMDARGRLNDLQPGKQLSSQQAGEGLTWRAETPWRPRKVVAGQ